MHTLILIYAVNHPAPGAGIDLRYPCCQGEVGQPGCQICPTGHVHEANKWLDPEGFVTTLPPLPSSLRERTTNQGDGEESDATSAPLNIYALDCEMVYTTAGCELARCTIVDSRFHTVMDCVVRPDHMVLDCNTRFSGLTQAEVESAELRITDVQAKLLHLFDSDSILIGHSLESDLTALKLIHSKVVDTSIVFPHRLGPPKKRALRNLVGDYLHRIIQQGGVYIFLISFLLENAYFAMLPPPFHWSCRFVYRYFVSVLLINNLVFE